MTELTRKSLTELSELLHRKEISVTEVVEAYLQRIDAIDPKIRAYLTVCADTAMKSAESLDREKKIPSGKPLWGLPIAVKDIYLTKGVRTTCASRILENYIPPYNATVIEKCIGSGAILLGKLNMDEFAMGSSNENSAFFPTANPWDIRRVPGGSSGGSAAAVAADLCIASLGTDTGGSIRQPASLCGVVGLKPTYGRVSRYGVIAFASSLDQMGPLTKTVKDCAVMMNVIAGHDARDSTSIDRPVPDYVRKLGRKIKGMKIGIPREYFETEMDDDVRLALEKAIALFKREGIETVDVSLPHTPYATAAYYIIAPAEASSNLARFDGVRYGLSLPADDLEGLYTGTKSAGFGMEVKRRIMLGSYVLSSGYYDAYYLKAQKARTLILRDFIAAFEKVDALIAPTSPTTAFVSGSRTTDPVKMYLSDIYTIAVNMAGLPAISIPCGLDGEGLPIGLQLIGRPFDEETVLSLGHRFEVQAALNLSPDLTQVVEI